MTTFVSDGIELAYIDVPAQGEPAGNLPVLLIHGFASNIKMNWIGPGWVTALTTAGYRVIAIDNRGHGNSEKIYNRERYGSPLMAEDARRLLDHLGIEKAHVMGYSMGARIAAFLAINHPSRVASCVFGGLGGAMLRTFSQSDGIADALEAKSIDDVSDPVGQTFRRFAENTGSDLRALAACMRSGRVAISRDDLASLQCPVLVAVGTEDEVAGSASELAEIFPNGRTLDIPGRDHMRAVGDKIYKSGVLQFLKK